VAIGRKNAVQIRNEEPCDQEAIHQLTERAFASAPYSDGTEAQIVRLLREHGDLTISLVAEEDGQIVGHVAFSPVTIDGRHEGWFGLGPISVEPARQRQGIGRSLIERGLGLLRGRHAHGCALIGSPDYYRRVGFRSEGRLSYGLLDSVYVQWIAFDGRLPSGELKFAPAFEQAGNTP
jgi:putative acetyltransferase